MTPHFFGDARLTTTSQVLDTLTQLQAYNEALRFFLLTSFMFLAFRESEEALLNNNRSSRRGEPRNIKSKMKRLQTEAMSQ